jgi:hypothetical protein
MRGIVALLAVAAVSATTGDAKNVEQTSATLTGTVEGATAVHFEYGTSASYGVATADRPVSTDRQNVEVPVSGLTSSTTYHYRVVAMNGADQAAGADRTFTTLKPPPQPAPPGVVTSVVRGVTSSGATLTGRVDPNGSATRYHFEYGTTSRLGKSTPEQSAGSGQNPIGVSAVIGGLAANDRIYYRLVATNAPGTRRGSSRSFVTARALRSASIALSAKRVVYGGPVTITGKLAGVGVSGVPMILQFQPHPFSAPFRQVGLSVNSGRDGSYRFTIGQLLLTARVRVSVLRGATLSSAVAVVHSTPRVGLIATRVPERRVRFHGTVRPALPAVVASLQRLSPSGRWVTVRRARVRGGRYAMTVRARPDASRYRVAVTPHDGGAHAHGYSRVRVP